MSKQTDLINIPDAITVDGSNVGIGTTPSAGVQLNVGNSANNSAVSRVTNGTVSVDLTASGSGLVFLEVGTNHPLVLATNATERMRIDSSGKVGIGTSSPSTKLTVLANSANGIDLAQDPDDGSNSGRLFFTTSGGSNSIRSTNGALQFSTGATAGTSSGIERMRIDTSGKVLVGKNASGMTVNGVELRTGVTNDYAFTATSLNQPVLLLNRHTDNGMIIRMRKANSDVGAIGNSGSGFYISGTTGADFGVLFDGSGLISCTGSGVIRDNQYDMGHGGFRWNDIYATNGSINTSDFNEKQDIASLTATEMLVGKRISALFKTFRWKDAVVEKGDNARTHTGVIAQDVQAAFTAEGLDVGDYALFTSFTWWEQEVEVPAVEAVAEVTDEDGNVTTEAIEAVDAYTNIEKYNTEAEAPEGATIKTRLGIRYLELLSFVAAYNEQRFASIEARLTALEA
jgi:hypothetical protein